MLYFYTAGSGYSPDHKMSWNTPQRITWTSTKAGQTSYPFNSPPEEDIEVEEVPAVSHSGVINHLTGGVWYLLLTFRTTETHV